MRRTAKQNGKNPATEKKLYALVKWVGGIDDGKFSPDIPVEYIKHFDYEEFTKCIQGIYDEDDISYVVEWRDTKQKPKGGWKNYDCLVLQVSPNVKVLEQALKIMGGHQSFSKKSEEKDNADSVPKNIIKEKKVDRMITNESDSSYSCDEKEEREVDMEQFSKFVYSTMKTLINADRQREIQIRELSSNVRTLSQQLDVILSILNGETDAARKVQNETAELKYEIGNKGSGFFVSKNQWTVINSRSTPSALATALTDALFDREVILRSNLKGGMSKIKTNEKEDTQNDQKLIALDPKKVDAIKDHVKIKFPEEFKPAQVGIAINNYCSRLRREAKKKLKNVNKENSPASTEDTNDGSYDV